MVTGTIYQSTKNQMLEQKWQKKKEELSKHKEPAREKTAEERMLDDFKERAEKERESNAHAGTYNKLASGGTLTEEEIEYLSTHDPEALSKYRQAQAEKKSYENALKNCKTREEAERLKMNKLGSFAMEAKKIVNNPYIPDAKKKELMDAINNRLCLVEDAQEEFARSLKYKELPKESEVQKERAEETREATDEQVEELTEANASVNESEEEKLVGENADDKQKEVEIKEVEIKELVKPEMTFNELRDEIRSAIRDLDIEARPKKVDISI